ncbi:MAG: hypothetical protein A4E23_01396 [Methanomethylovorans sp. PtaU1.Bin073]|nr:MAG: hypothetical protein A4E23_01396 [Methanomethylovorans sp. PtaU1.Bin073]
MFTRSAAVTLSDTFSTEIVAALPIPANKIEKKKKVVNNDTEILVCMNNAIQIDIH